MYDPLVNKLVGSGSNLEPVGQDYTWRASGDDEGEWTPEAIQSLLSQVMTAREIADGLGLGYDTIVKACRESRIQARQSGQIWLTTIAAVEKAIEAGSIRPKTK